MARYENETQSMIEDPPNLQCRNYPPATTSMIISLTDIPWYPPYTPDASHYHNCLEIGLCLSGEGMAEMGGGDGRRKMAFFGRIPADGAEGRLSCPA